MGEIIFILSAVIFFGGLLLVTYQATNHKT